MPTKKHALLVVTLAVIGMGSARPAQAQTIGDVFYIDMENHNLTQPNGNISNSSTLEQLLGNPAAPYLNSLITPGNANAAQTSWASAYHNVLATPSGNNASIHPSEPNYIWQEGGSNYGVTNDNDPYASSGANVQTSVNLTGLLQNAGVSWKSYQEDTQLVPSSGSVNNPGSNSLTSTVAAPGLYTVPTLSYSGTSSSYTNAYNGTHQYDFAAKHDGTLFYTDTNGGTQTAPDMSTSNPEASHYAPLQQLLTDVTNSTAARYNLITPDLYNDAHSALSGGFTYNGTHFTGDPAAIAQADNFLSKLIPQIEASPAYKNNGAIFIWWDETESQGSGDTTINNYSHTLDETAISPLAKGNAYQSTLNYTHSSDLRTMQELYGVTSGGFLGDAASAGTNDLSDLFVSGAVTTAPEPSPIAIFGLGALGIFGLVKRA